MKNILLIVLMVTIIYACKKEKLHENRPNPDDGHIACLEIESISNENMVPSEVCFSASCSGNSVSYEWDFDGNGQIDATGVNVCHVFEESGTFRTILTTKNSSGNTKNDDETINILPATIIPSFTIENDNCTAKCGITFTNTSANLIGNESFAWDFGNGQQSDNQHPETIEYEIPNEYNVELCVSRGNESPVCTTQSVTVLSTITFSKVVDFGDDYVISRAIDITRTRDGGYAIIGEGTINFTDYNLLFVKLGEDYEIKAQEVINDGGRDLRASSIGELPSGELVILASDRTGLDENILFLRATQEGLVINEFAFAGSFDVDAKGMSIIPENGDVVIIGQTSSSLQNSIIARVRTSPNFSVVWQKEFPLNGYISGIARGIDGHLMVVGDNNEAIFSRKINANNGTSLNFVTYKSQQNANNDREKGNAIIAYREDYAITGKIDNDAALILIDKDGNEKARKKIPGNFDDAGNALTETLDGDLLITGTFWNQPIEDPTLFAVKTNFNSGNNFYRTEVDYKGAIGTMGNDGVPTEDGGYLLAGSSGGFWIIKTDAT
ncbi:MAG: PKD domain-containing protein, partial [Bacteroidota bacterium]